MQVIETEYNGYKFRSRLEARWAVFFDSLGIKYEYEPEGFLLDDGSMYLPDFRVRCCGTRGNCDPDKSFDLYIEVKGRLTDADMKKIEMFSGYNGFFYTGNASSFINPTLIVGDIPNAGCATEWWGDFTFFSYRFIDGDDFGAFPAADKHGNFYLFGDDSNYINRDDEEYVELAYTVARQARFEHGACEEDVVKKFHDAVIWRRLYGKATG